VQRRIVSWHEVSEEEGSGVVHIAPGCGAEDYELSVEYGLQALAPLDEEGRYVEGYGEWTGRRCDEVGPRVVEHLRQRQMSDAQEEHKHRYPHCWRCGGELVFRLVDEWFIACDEVRPQLMAAIEQVRWVPEHAGKRMQDWLRNMGDWCISRTGTCASIAGASGRARAMPTSARHIGRSTTFCRRYVGCWRRC
jgi:isoleucyl-tRNA synthetase